MVPPSIALALFKLIGVELTGPAAGSTRILWAKESETALSAQKLDAAACEVCAIAALGHASTAAEAATAKVNNFGCVIDKSLKCRRSKPMSFIGNWSCDSHETKRRNKCNFMLSQRKNCEQLLLDWLN
jgi:hypothetical protein